MNVDEIITKNKFLEEENKKLQDELIQTKEHLKKYTNNTKRYYEKNKEEIIQKVKDYREITNYIVPPEVIKERNKKADLDYEPKVKLYDGLSKLYQSLE